TEVPTFLLNEAILDSGLKLVVPCDLEQPRWGQLDPVQHTRALYRRFNPHPPLLSKEMHGNDLAKLGLKFIFLPALAVDRTQVRLGRGAGWYDQALAHCNLTSPPRPQLIALTHDWEVLQAGTLPHEPHDQLVDQVLTSSGRLQKLDSE
ncbi:MAG: 5-formyltetrahydrofolate cyclo-ligase, partial [Varibaculum cambriense]|nr:5-formyltetrahydrofolate cyclo-ligase [Varibaculum cambriense]